MSGRRLPNDWYDGVVPDNVVLDPTAYIGTSYAFQHFRSEQREALRVGHGACVSDGTLLDVGPGGRVIVGEYAIIACARLICDESIVIGAYAAVSWDAVLMDVYRFAPHPALLRPRPIHIGPKAWIGFGACVLPGVSIGEGAIVGARAVVAEDVPAFALAVGNPARIVRR
jgi:carbonic anhydrase/acetyltransferase-like protein (isoleucine patch superfamily)